MIAAIEEYIAVHNQNPKYFAWRAKANDILQKVIHANSRLGSKKKRSTTLDRIGKSEIHHDEDPEKDISPF